MRSRDWDHNCTGGDCPVAGCESRAASDELRAAARRPRLRPGDLVRIRVGILLGGAPARVIEVDGALAVVALERDVVRGLESRAGGTRLAYDVDDLELTERG